MRKMLTNRLFVTAVAAAMLGVASSAVEARAAAPAPAPCGDDSMCYSVPDGCGVGRGCNTTICEDELCPSILGGEDICKFCGPNA